MLHSQLHDGGIAGDRENLAPLFARRAMTHPVPRYELPSTGMDPEAAYQLVHDELQLDGNPLLNLASFVTTWMEPQADRLLAETLAKNAVDADEYPQTVEIQQRCVNVLAHLFNAPGSGEAVGTATVGSSEAIHLAGLAMKWRWRALRKSAGKPADQPNIVMGSHVQVVWEKFARYFDVEPRYVPCSGHDWGLRVPEAMRKVDENTIGVVGILGSTYTGGFDPIAELDAALTALNTRSGLDVPIHVDAASGGFVAPFTKPGLAWDFRLSLVRSINTSGHKYGLVYPGIGWVLWRDKADLPEDLIFHVSYLGGDQATFNLNFSRGASQIIGQYYNFLRLGRSGYTEIMQALTRLAARLAGKLEATGHVELLSRGQDLPLVCFKLTGERPYNAHEVSEQLRCRGWIVPAYPMPPDIEDTTVLRVVVREGMSRDLVDALATDFNQAIDILDRSHSTLPPGGHATNQAAPVRPVEHRAGKKGTDDSRERAHKAGHRGVC
ncbi:MAG: glutamate decarboxylase [Acidimicrobiales bacterium]